MQPRSINQVLKELNSVSPFKAQNTAIQNRLKQIPKELQSDEQSLIKQINQQSLSSAQSRGLGFSGIPIREAAELSAPALADLRKNSRNNALTLQQALASGEASLLDSAIGIREAEAGRAFTARQNELNRRASAAAAASSNNYQGIIEGLREQIAQLSGGSARGGSAARGPRQLVEAENRPGVFVDPSTGRVTSNPFFGRGSQGRINVQNDEFGRPVYTGGF